MLLDFDIFVSELFPTQNPIKRCVLGQIKLFMDKILNRKT